MKRVIFTGLATATLLFTGCASSLNMAGIGKSDVKQVFQKGTIENSQKVLVGKSKLSILKYAVAGAGAGAGAGALIGGNSQSGLIGAGVGAGVGLLTSVFQEVEAYQVEIKNLKSGKVVVAYLEQEVPINSIVEYVVREDEEVTNVNVTTLGSPKYVEKEKIIYRDRPTPKQTTKSTPKQTTKSTPKPVEKEVVKETVKPVEKEVVKPVESKPVEKTETNNNSIW